MVRLWAEKEMRNLARMYSAGLPVPQPILLRSHVLMMSFVGKDGWPAPKLKVTTDIMLSGKLFLFILFYLSDLKVNFNRMLD